MIKIMNKIIALVISLILIPSISLAETKQQQEAKKQQEKAYNQGPDQRQINQQKANSGIGTSVTPKVEPKSPYTVGNQQLNNDDRIRNSIEENLKSPPKKIIPPKK
jgi:hypothetical protein